MPEILSDITEMLSRKQYLMVFCPNHKNVFKHDLIQEDKYFSVPSMNFSAALVLFRFLLL